MNEYDLLRAIGDINEKYIENAVAEEETLTGSTYVQGETREQTKSKRQKNVRKTVAAAMIVATTVITGLLVLQFIIHKWGNNDAEGDIRPTGEQTARVTPMVSVPPQSLCEEYQFMVWQATEYVASVETCDHIGTEMGTARVRNEEKESETTLFKDVVVYEFVGMDPKIAVVVLFPDEQEYHVYYNGTN